MGGGERRLPQRGCVEPRLPSPCLLTSSACWPEGGAAGGAAEESGWEAIERAQPAGASAALGRVEEPESRASSALAWGLVIWEGLSRRRIASGSGSGTWQQFPNPCQHVPLSCMEEARVTRLAARQDSEGCDSAQSAIAADASGVPRCDLFPVLCCPCLPQCIATVLDEA